MNMWGLSAPAFFRELLANLAMGVPAIRRRRLLGVRTGNESISTEAAKIASEFEFLHGSAGDLQGKTVLEIGPGDAIGLAPLFLQAGAARYIALDRFLGDVWNERAQNLYDALERACGPFPSDWKSRVELIRHSVESPASVRPAADVIISFDVVEHLADVPRAVEHMTAMLKPEGRMVHRVDYGPHGVWIATADPWSFLRVPQWLWMAIGSNRGYPNRLRHSQFMQLLRGQGLQVVERITRTHGNDVLDAEVVCGFEAAALGAAFKLNRTPLK